MNVTLQVAPIVIALFALVVSSIGLIFTARTYSVSHRPYVGVVDMPFQLIETPPRAIRWKLVLKNVGSLPAFVRVDENVAELSTPSGTSRLGSLGAIGKTGTLLMPGQTIDLLGQYTEVGGPVRMSDILNGQVTLDVSVKASYEFPSWLWKGRRTYQAKIRFHTVSGVPPGFVMVSAGAN